MKMFIRFAVLACAAGPAGMNPAMARTLPIQKIVSANRAATVEPETERFINARQVYVWADGAVYHAFTAPGMVTDIALQPGEGLVAVAAGDTARWVIGDTASGEGEAKQTHILVKPFSAGLVTNLVVTTDRRTYHLKLTSSAGSAMAALSWTYPQDELIALKRASEAAREARPLASGLDVGRLYFGYAISGDKPSWRPVRAFDDGRQTFIEFPVSIGVDEAPPLFLLGPRGEAQLVNYRMEGRFYVVNRLFSAAELRLGTKQQQVVRITRGTATRRRP